MLRQLIYDDRKMADIFIADTFIKRLLGYMFRKHPHYEAILIKPCSSIHTYFMMFDIDVLFLNKDMEVIRRIERLEKNKMIMPVKDASMVMEAPSGTFADIAFGSKVEIR